MKALFDAVIAVARESKSPAVVNLVNTVRYGAHKAGALPVDVEAEFQRIAAKHGGNLVKFKLHPLPEVAPGMAVESPAPAPAHVPEPVPAPAPQPEAQQSLIESPKQKRKEKPAPAGV